MSNDSNVFMRTILVSIPFATLCYMYPNFLREWFVVIPALATLLAIFTINDIGTENDKGVENETDPWINRLPYLINLSTAYIITTNIWDFTAIILTTAAPMATISIYQNHTDQ